MSAASTICGSKRRGLEGLSSSFHATEGWRLSLPSAHEVVSTDHRKGGSGAREDWLPALPAHGAPAGCFVGFEESTGAAMRFSTP